MSHSTFLTAVPDSSPDRKKEIDQVTPSTFEVASGAPVVRRSRRLASKVPEGNETQETAGTQQDLNLAEVQTTTVSPLGPPVRVTEFIEIEDIDSKSSVNFDSQRKSAKGLGPPQRASVGEINHDDGEDKVQTVEVGAGLGKPMRVTESMNIDEEDIEIEESIENDIVDEDIDSENEKPVDDPDRYVTMAERERRAAMESFGGLGLDNAFVATKDHAWLETAEEPMMSPRRHKTASQRAREEAFKAFGSTGLGESLVKTESDLGKGPAPMMSPRRHKTAAQRAREEALKAFGGSGLDSAFVKPSGDRYAPKDGANDGNEEEGNVPHKTAAQRAREEALKAFGGSGLDSAFVKPSGDRYAPKATEQGTNTAQQHGYRKTAAQRAREEARKAFGRVSLGSTMATSVKKRSNLIPEPEPEAEAGNEENVQENTQSSVRA